MVDGGTLEAASATTLALSREKQDRLFADADRYADSVVLRPVDVTNAAELIERFGVVAVNSALEIDLYGHVNSSHVDGARAVNGLGGSGDFNQAGLVTEVGISDLRGLSPRERAGRIIEVAHPDYRPALSAYRKRADEYGGPYPTT